MVYKYTKQRERKKKKTQKTQKTQTNKKKSGGTWPPPSPKVKPFTMANPGEKGGNLEHLDLILINVQKITNNYANQNTKNIRELGENINRSFAHYLSKDIIEKKRVSDDLQKIEDKYLSKRK